MGAQAEWEPEKIATRKPAPLELPGPASEELSEMARKAGLSLAVDVLPKRRKILTPTIIRCSIPDCDWGLEASDSSRMGECYRAYSQHCIKMHHADAESFIHLSYILIWRS